MEIRFVPLDLAQMDTLRFEAAAFAFFEDERPLRGAAGLCDWRMLGKISRHIARGWIDGRAGERSLIPARPRLSFDKLVLFGLGASDRFDERVFTDTVNAMLQSLHELRLRSFVIALPGRTLRKITAADAVRMFAGLAIERGEFDQAVVLEEADAIKPLAAVLEQERRRIRAARELEGG